MPENSENINKEYFITQYTEIHNNLYRLEKEIDKHQKDKTQISLDSSILENLIDETNKEIERLNKTRKHEREIFNY
jgi:hypothetical protein